MVRLRLTWVDNLLRFGVGCVSMGYWGQQIPPGGQVVALNLLNNLYPSLAG